MRDTKASLTSYALLECAWRDMRRLDHYRVRNGVTCISKDCLRSDTTGSTVRTYVTIAGPIYFLPCEDNIYNLLGGVSRRHHIELSKYHIHCFSHYWEKLHNPNVVYVGCVTENETRPTSYLLFPELQRPYRTEPATLDEPGRVLSRLSSVIHGLRPS